MGRPRYDVTRVSGTVSAGNNDTVVAAVTNKVIRIWKLTGTMSAAGTVTLTSSGGSALSPAFNVAANGPLVLGDFRKLKTLPGEGLKIAAATGNFAYELEYYTEP